MRPVSFPVPAEVACAYLADPVHRPEWQSSLRAVEVIDAGPPHVGQRWTDVTVPGLRPAMRTTAYEPGVRWAEHGTWRGFSAHVGLAFTDTATGCDVTLSARVRGWGVLAVLGPPLTWSGRLAGRADLRRAAHILGARGEVAG
jgi:hypothetical protein